MVAKNRIREFLKSKRVFLLDLDGTLYSGSKSFEGVSEIVCTLERLGKEVFYFTNNSSKDEADVISRLAIMGVEAKMERVVISTHSFIRFLRGQTNVRRLFLVANSKCQNLLQRAGFECVRAEDAPQAVVFGFDTELTYEKLRSASLIIQNEVPFYGIHGEYHCPTEGGLIPDCGSLLKLIEVATHRKPKRVLGKPSAEMIHVATDRLAFSPREAVFIGDNIDTDVSMAKKFGASSILVLSGETDRKELRRKKTQPKTYSLEIVKRVFPDLILSDISEIRGYL